MIHTNPRARVAVSQEPPEWPEEPRFVAVPVRPTLFGRQSMSRDSAKRIISDKSNAFHAEADAVLTRGEHWIWT